MKIKILSTYLKFLTWYYAPFQHPSSIAFFSQCIVLSNIVSNGKAYLRKNSKRKQFGKTINFKAASD